nr:beta-N-acetylhexosaminidase [Candidatus Sigynarchaeum springense]
MSGTKARAAWNIRGKGFLLLSVVFLASVACLNTAWLIDHEEKRASARKYPIIPRPSMMEPKQGYFMANENTRVLVDAAGGNETALLDIGNYIAGKLGVSLNCTITVAALTVPGSLENVILLELSPADTRLGLEGYTMDVTQSGIVIAGFQPAGVFYGIQTLLQIFPPEVAAGLSLGHSSTGCTVPCVTIRDVPRFSYRGMHLDVSRHFFPVAFIKRYIDLLAMYKLNTFHWHLTDDQGWRIEIDAYPLLTQVGAYRPGEDGGFYSKEEVQEILEHARQRHVTIIPEIEMPGHSSAARASYPALGCTGGPSDQAFCAGKEATFTFLDAVLAEVIDMFPGRLIHVGGDECSKDSWHGCPDCQARMVAEGLANEEELQGYFIRRIAGFIASQGREMVGWNEIMQGGLAENATVMAWNSWGAAIDAARAGHPVVMTPTGYCYFDYYQADPETEPLAIGGYTPLVKVYHYEPVPVELDDEEARLIIGTQANVWAEYISTPEHAEYMCLPRMCALAEVAWSPRDGKDWETFKERVVTQFGMLDLLGVNYCTTTLNADPAF